jgi:hypothetical protein
MLEAAQGGQAGMAAGKQVDLGGGECGRLPVTFGGIVEACRVETPAGERIGVAVHHADAQVADAPPCRQRRLFEARKDVGVPRGGGRSLAWIRLERSTTASSTESG